MRRLRRGVESAGSRPGTSDHSPHDHFPGFDVLREVDTWDPVTAGAVLARLSRPAELRFFTVSEEATGRCLVDQLLDQRDEPRVPVLGLIDSRLAEQETDGWRYEDMPEDGEAWRRSLRALDEDAIAAYGEPFRALDWRDQAALVQRVQDLAGADWHGMPARHVWSLWTRYACTAFYSHPWAWNEIGFGGPAYPRGYKHLGLDAREPWEVPDAGKRSPTGWGRQVEDARRRSAAQRHGQHAGETG